MTNKDKTRIANLIIKHDLFYAGDGKYLMDAIGGSNENRLYGRIAISEDDLYGDNAEEFLNSCKEYLEQGIEKEIEHRQSMQ